MAVKKIGEGAEAIIYTTRFMSRSAVLKRRMPKNYRARAIDELLRRQRTKNEARAIALAHESGVRSPELLLVADYEILMGVMRGTMLSNYMRKSKKEMRSIMREIGKAAALMHNAGLAHGDYTPANIIISGSHAGVIDFGMATMLPSTEDKAMDLILMKRSVSPSDYRTVETAYRKFSSDSAKVLNRVSSIERRGRYKTRTLETFSSKGV